MCLLFNWLYFHKLILTGFNIGTFFIDLCYIVSIILFYKNTPIKGIIFLVVYIFIIIIHFLFLQFICRRNKKVD